MTVASGINGTETVNSVLGAMGLHSHSSPRAESFASKINNLIRPIFVTSLAHASCEPLGIAELSGAFKNARSEAKPPSSTIACPSVGDFWQNIQDSKDDTLKQAAISFFEGNYNFGIIELTDGLTELKKRNISKPILEVDYAILLSLCVFYKGEHVDTCVEGIRLSTRLLNLAQEHLSTAHTDGLVDEQDYSKAQLRLNEGYSNI